MRWLDEGRRLRARVDAGSVPGLHLLLRTFGGTTLLVLGVNVVGAAVVTLLLLALHAHTSGQLRLVIGTVGAGYGVFAVVVGTVLLFVLQGRTLRWVAAGRRPTAEEARTALRNPLDLALVTGTLWIVGAFVLGPLVLANGGDPRDAFGLVAGLVLSGLTTAGMTFLIAAQVGRPVSVLALELCPPSEPTMFTMRARMLVTWALTAGVPLLGLIVVIATPSEQRVDQAALLLVVVALVVGFVGFGLLARAVGQPTEILADALHEIGRGRLDRSVQVEVDDVGEIGTLQRGVNDMVAGLRERERIRELFGRQVGTAVAAEAIGSGLPHAAQARDVVALFIDITGSTELTGELPPAEFVSLLNRFFAEVVAAVERENGLVNKFEGDGALCVFGAPVRLDDPAGAGLRAARGMRNRVMAAGEVDVGIGVAYGAVVVGEIGATSRHEYTVIGDAVNEASRLTGEAKHVAGRILASAATVDAASAAEQRCWTRGDSLMLRGRPCPTVTYRSVAPRPVP